MRRRGTNKRDNNFKMEFIQLNQRKCKNCMDHINMKLSRKESFIFMGQEPHYYRSKVTGLDSQHQIIHAKGEECRAYVYAHKYVPLLFDSEKSDKDTCTTLWITKDHSIPKINVISSYWEGSNPEIPSKLVESVTENGKLNNEMIISMDSNAHTDLTGSTHTDARGAKLEQFILRHNLEIVNNSTDYTFESPVGKSRIDISL